MLRRAFVFSCLLILILSVSTFAAAPRLINFQGKLTTAGGTAETGSQNLTFRIYNVETGGASIWDETVNGVILDSAGQFSTVLGLGGSPSNLTINFSQPLWLQVEYGGQIFTPRQRLSSVPYALYAITAESLAGGISQEIINLTVNNNITVSGTGDSTFNGSVGIGTTDATSKLTVAGTAEVTGFKMLTGAVSGYVLTTNASGVGTWQPATGGGSLPSGTSGQTLRHNGATWIANSVLFNDGINVGIGTTSPAQKLTVAGSIEITGTGNGIKFPDGTIQTTKATGGVTQEVNYLTVNNNLTVSGTAEVTGTLKIGAYTLPNTDGTAGQVLKTDGSGAVTWMNDNVGGGSGGGNISGSGTFNRVAKFTGTNDIGSSTITDNGTNVSMTGNLAVSGSGNSSFAGKVGIGTTDPGTSLDVRKTGTYKTTFSDVVAIFGNSGLGSSAISILSHSAGASYINFGDPDNELIGQIVYGNVDNSLGFKTNGISNRMFINSAGNVGIGTTDPGTNKLKVAGIAEMIGFKMLTGAVSGDVLTVNADGVGTWQAPTGGITQEVNNLTVNNYLTVSGTGDSSFAGRVLIGITPEALPPDVPPTLKLAVNGDVYSAGTIEAEGDIGAKGEIRTDGDINADGVIRANGTGESFVRGGLHTEGNIDANGTINANGTGESRVGGNFGVGGKLGVGGTLEVTGSIITNGNLNVNSTNESIFNGNIRANKSIIAEGDIGTLGNINASALWAQNSISTNGSIEGHTLSVNDITATSLSGANNIYSNWFTASYGINAAGNITSTGGNISADNGSIYGAHMSSPDKHFLIDHPLDPKNKVLIHSSVESPDRMNIYNGIIILDEKGEAVVELPAYFEALNKDHRYQLTPVGDYAPLYIKQKVKDNKFVIAGGKPGLEVCWMVTGIRQDAFALKNPLVVEEEKGTGTAKNYTKGTYIYPEGFK